MPLSFTGEMPSFIWGKYKKTGTLSPGYLPGVTAWELLPAATQTGDKAYYTFIIKDMLIFMQATDKKIKRHYIHNQTDKY